MTTTYPANRGPSDSVSSNSKSDAALLKRIRERFDYMVRAWQKIREDAAFSMQALSRLGPWPAAERKQRDDDHRPCLHFDQLNQYVNDLVNELRLNPLGIKVMPVGSGANDETANLLADRIRQIEYESNAQDAYRVAFENAVQRGYGVFEVLTDYVSWDSFDVRLKIKAYVNPDMTYWDPDCKEPDCSDMQDAVTFDRILKTDFERLYPDAHTTSFGQEYTGLYPQWFDNQTVQVAAYTYLEKQARTLYLLDDGSPEGLRVFRDELDKGFRVNRGYLTFANGNSFPILKQKEAEKPQVKRVITNGVEILKRFDIVGSQIPIFPVVGREKYVSREGATSKKVERTLESYHWNSIDAQLSYDHFKTTETELVKMVPKTPYVGYEGQFENHEDEWKEASDKPVAFLTVKPVMDATGQAVLPLPRREAYEPAIQALEVGAESSRRGIQAGLGSYGFTRLDDTNVKSGKAINLLDKQSDLGSFHFIDNFKSTLKRAGKYYVEVLPIIEDTVRDVGIRKEDGEHKVIRLNETVMDPTGKPTQNVYGLTKDAQHDVTISTGPSYQSQREEAGNFADSLAGQPELMARIGDLVVKLKNLGPIGDQIADRLKPPGVDDKNGIPPQIQAQIQQQIQQYEMALHDAMQQLEQLQKVIDAKQIETQSRKEIELAKIDADRQIQALKIDLEKLKLGVEKQLTHEKLTSQENIVDEQITSAEKIALHQAQHESEQNAEDRKSAEKQARAKPTPRE